MYIMWMYISNIDLQYVLTVVYVLAILAIFYFETWGKDSTRGGTVGALAPPATETSCNVPHDPTRQHNY